MNWIVLTAAWAVSVVCSVSLLHRAVLGRRLVPIRIAARGRRRSPE